MRIFFVLLLSLFLQTGRSPFIDYDAAGKPMLDRGKPVPPKGEIVGAWQKRQDAIKSFRFAWTEEQTHPNGWLANPRYPQREWLSIPGLLRDRTYSVSKRLAVDGNKLRYSFELDRKAEPDGIRVPAGPDGRADGLGLRRHYSYLSVFDGRTGKSGLTSLMEAPPPVMREFPYNVDAQNLDARPIMIALRPLDPVMGHLLIDRAVTNQVRGFYRGKSMMLLEEQHDPSGWKTILTIEPERDYLVSRFMSSFEQKIIVDINIDYVRDARWGWIPNGWRLTQMLADGSKRVTVVAKVTRYDINVPIGAEDRRQPSLHPLGSAAALHRRGRCVHGALMRIVHLDDVPRACC